MSQSKCQLGAYKIPQYTLVSLSLKRIVWHFNHRLYWLFSLFPSRTFTTNWPKRQCGFCFYSNTQCILWKMPFQMPQEAHQARARSPAVGQCDGAAEPNLRRSVSGKWCVCVCVVSGKSSIQNQPSFTDYLLIRSLWQRRQTRKYSVLSLPLTFDWKHR